MDEVCRACMNQPLLWTAAGSVLTYLGHTAWHRDNFENAGFPLEELERIQRNRVIYSLLLGVASAPISIALNQVLCAPQ